MVRNDTVAVIGRSLDFEIKKQKKTIPVMANMLGLDSRTIYKSINSENVAPEVIRKYAEYFKLPVSFFTDQIADNDVILKPITNWKNYYLNSQQDEDFDYETLFNENIEKSKFDTLYKLIDKFLEELEKLVKKNKSDKQKVDKRDKLRRLKNLYELSSLGEEISKNKIKVFLTRINFWETEIVNSDWGTFEVYSCYKKQFLIFTDDIRSTKYYHRVNTGKIPPNPYKTFVEKPDHEDIIINGFNYKAYDFKYFWGSTFIDRRIKADEELKEELNRVYEEVMLTLIPGFDEELGHQIPYPKNFDNEIDQLLKSRDKEIKTINDEEAALNAIDEEEVKNDK